MTLQRVGLIAVLNMTQFNRAYNQYIRRLGIMNATTIKTSKSLSGQFLGLGNSLLKVAAILSGAVVIGAGLAVAAMSKLAIDGIREAAELEQQIANIASTMNLTKEEALFLKDVIIDLGLDPRLRVTTFEAAEAMDLLAKNGVFAGMSIAQMETTAREAGTAVILLANATGAEFGQAANIASSVMAIFNKEATDMVDIVSGITSVTTNSKFTINDYEVALRNGGAAAAIMGVSLEDFNTVIAASAEEMGTGMKAGTGLLNFMNRLTPNTVKATKAMKALGLITADGTNRFFDASGELKDMADISLILNDALFGTQKVMGEVGGRTAEQNKLLGELNSEYKSAEDTIAKYTTGVDALLASEDEKNAAISEAQEIMGKLSPTISELNGIQGELIETTQTLTTEQRSMAMETIFGNDAMKTTIAIATEGALVMGRLDEVTEAYGISFQEAAKMVEDGLTEFELMQQQMSKTDAIKNAETRMDTLKGKLEILGGVFEAVRISFGDEFIGFLTTLAEKFLALIEEQDDILGMVSDFGAALAGMFESLINGESAMSTFVTFLGDIGQGDLGQKLTNLATSIRNFITPIAEFVDEHSDAFIGALKGIGAVLAGSAISAIIAGIGSAIALLVSPLGLVFIAVATLGAIWESNWLGIQDVVLGAIDSIVGALESSGILGIIEGLISAFNEGGVEGLLAELPSALAGIGEIIATAFDEIDWLAIGASIVTEISTAFTDMQSGIDEIDWNGIGEVVGEKFATGFGIVEDRLRDIDWEGTFDGLGDVFGKDIDGKGIVEKIKTALAVLITTFTVIGSVAKAFILTIKEAMPEAFAGAKEGIEAFEPTIERLKELWLALMPVFAVVGAIIGAIVLALVGVFVGMVAGILNALEPFLKTLAFVVEGVAQFVQGIVEVITGLFLFIAGIVTNDMTLFEEGWDKMSEGITNIILGLVLTVVALFTGLRETIVALLVGFIEGIIGFFQHLFDVLVGNSIIPDLVNAIIEWFVTLALTVLERVSSFLLSILNFFTEKTAQILSIIAGWVTSLILKFTLLKLQVIQKITEMWVKLAEIVDIKRKELLETFKKFVEDVKKAFTDIDWVAAGRNIIDGIAEGIIAGLASAKAAVLGVAEGIKDAWDDFWATHSPSRLMIESGQDIMKGADLGIEREESSVMNTISGIGSKMYRAFTESVSDIDTTGGTIYNPSVFKSLNDNIRNILPNAPSGNNTISNSNQTTNNFNVENSFSGQPQINDSDGLRIALAGFG